MDLELYNTMAKRWQDKQRREQSRFAMLALVAAHVAGDKSKTQNDFMGEFAEDENA